MTPDGVSDLHGGMKVLEMADVQGSTKGFILSTFEKITVESRSAVLAQHTWKQNFWPW